MEDQRRCSRPGWPDSEGPVAACVRRPFAVGKPNPPNNEVLFLLTDRLRFVYSILCVKWWPWIVLSGGMTRAEQRPVGSLLRLLSPAAPFLSHLLANLRVAISMASKGNLSRSLGWLGRAADQRHRRPGRSQCSAALRGVVSRGAGCQSGPMDSGLALPVESIDTGALLLDLDQQIVPGEAAEHRRPGGLCAGMVCDEQSSGLPTYHVVLQRVGRIPERRTSLPRGRQH